MKRRLNGINITYRYTKRGEKVVLLLHGWGGNLNSFRTLEDFLIKNNFSVITLDFPGFGGSEQPTENFDLWDYKKIVLELLQIENISKTSIVAHSFGGRVAFLLASENPENIDKLVLCDVAGIKPKFNLSLQFKIWKYKLLKKLKQKGLIKRELLIYGSDDYRAMPENLKSVFNRIVKTDLTKYLSSILSPTLILWGRSDKDTPIYMAKKINKKIKDSAIIYFEGGHFWYLDNAIQFNLIVKNFFE